MDSDDCAHLHCNSNAGSASAHLATFEILGWDLFFALQISLERQNPEVRQDKP